MRSVSYADHVAKRVELGAEEEEDNASTSTSTSRPHSRSTLSGVFEVPTSAKANLDGYTFLTLSLGLRIFHSTVLALLITLVLWLTFSIVKHRKVPAMQLSQPSVLAFFTMSSAVAIGGCYLLIPWSDWTCTFRQPVILTALSLSGSVLAGRVWRISTIMSPVLSLGGASSFGGGGGGRMGSLHASDSETSLGDGASEEMSRTRRRRRRKMQKRIVEMKRRTMEVLSLISNWKRLLRCLHLRRGSYYRQNARRRNSAMSIRRKVPVDRLLFLVFVLMIPQIVLQILNVALPVMRETRAIHFDDEIMVAYHKCQRPSGLASFIVGVVLALCPYFLTFLLSFDSDGLPDVFDELQAFVRACHIFLIVTVGSVPAAALARTPDTQLYATTFLVVGGTVMPPIRFIVINKLKPIWRGEKVMVVSHLLRRLGTGGGRGSATRQRRRRTSVVDDTDDADGTSQSVTQTSNSQDDRHKRRHQAEANAKAANLALTVGKMYEDIGQSKKTVQIYDDALNLWKTDHNRRDKALIGDYTEDEVNSFMTKEILMICDLLIAKGRVLGSLASEDSRATSKAAEAWLDALDIFAFAPAAADIRDRSIIFPCFSGIFVFLKGGKIQKPASFEGDLVRRFVAETKKHHELSGDPVHYARALAMQAEVLAKDSRFDEALDAFFTMKSVYDINEHSDLVSKHYGTDRCAQAYAFSSLWYIEVGKKELGVRSCEYVIDEVLDKMDPTNVLNFNVTLLPIIKLLKSRGEASRARDLYEKYVIKNYEKHFKDGAKTPAKPLMRPMMLLLKLCETSGQYSGMDADIEFMAEGNNGEVPPMLDNIYTSLCCSLSSLSAEICLLLTERIIERNADVKRPGDLALTKILIRKGASLAKKADAKMKDEECGVKFKLAYETHEPILRRLEDLASQHGVDLTLDPNSAGDGKGGDQVKGTGQPTKNKKSSLDMLATHKRSRSKRDTNNEFRHSSYQGQHQQRATMDTLRGFSANKKYSSERHFVTFGDELPRREIDDVIAHARNADSPPPIISRGQLPVISAVSGTSASELQVPADEPEAAIPTTFGSLKKDGTGKKLDRRASGTSSKGSKGSLGSLASSILGAFSSGKQKNEVDAFIDDDSLSRGEEEEDIESGINGENVVDLNGSADLSGGDNRLSLPSPPTARSGIFKQMERASKRRLKTK